MATLSPTPPGMCGIRPRYIPDEWDREWFRDLLLNQLQPGDVRNANAGTGIAITQSGVGRQSPIISATGAGGVILTTKGDLIGFNGTNYVRIPVGADGTKLTADSTAAAGVRWV